MYMYIRYIGILVISPLAIRLASMCCNNCARPTANAGINTIATAILTGICVIVPVTLYDGWLVNEYTRESPKSAT